MIEADVTALHQKQTRAFIEANPSSLRLVRHVRESDGAGGVQAANPPATLAPQRVRVVERGTSPVTVVPEGFQLSSDLALVGMPDMNVEIQDTFDYLNHNCEVTRVLVFPDWRVVAEASRRG